SAQAQRERQVLGDAHVRVQRVALEHHGDVALGGGDVVDDPLPDAQGAGGDRLQPRDHPQHRGLAAARRPHQHQPLAVGDLEAGAGHGDVAVVVDLAQVVELHARHRCVPRRVRFRAMRSAPRAMFARRAVDAAWTSAPDDCAILACNRFQPMPPHAAQDNAAMTRSPDTDFSFPDGFLWGAATAAHQIEGSPLADGAGPSTWTRFAHTPGMTLNGDTGDLACDHYHRWKDDVRLMRELGLQAYRFSVSWSRILPEGTGRVNRKGLDFYSRLVDELLANDIEPLLTLFHWDLPAALDDRGGWLNRDCADWFAEYGRVLYRALDGRVKKWVTLNEPWVITDGGYLHGALAPGHRSRYEAPIASHKLMRAHGAAVQAYRAEGAHEVGLVVNIEPKYPASDSPEDAAATRRAHAYMNKQYLHPALLGRYPPELAEIFGDAWPQASDEDMRQIAQPIDFVGINYYTRSVTAASDSYPLKAGAVRQPLGTYTETGWEVFPQRVTDTLA